MDKLALKTQKTNTIVKFDAKNLLELLNGSLAEIVEDVLNSLMDWLADELCKAPKYRHCKDVREDSRAGTYTRKLKTRIGELTLRIPHLRKLSIAAHLFWKYRHREDSIDDICQLLYVSGISIQRLGAITGKLFGGDISKATLSSINRKLYSRLDGWRNRELQRRYEYVFMDAMYLKRCWGGEIHNVAIMVSIGVDSQGKREVLGIREGNHEDRESWCDFLRDLKERGVKDIGLIVSDKCSGLHNIIAQFFPEAKWQRCIVHWYRNAFSKVPRSKAGEVMECLKAIHAQENIGAARRKAEEVIGHLHEMKLHEAAKFIAETVEETLTYMNFPHSHWRKIRTNNCIERLNREIRRRTSVVGAFPDATSAIMLVTAQLNYIVVEKWGKRYMIV